MPEEQIAPVSDYIRSVDQIRGHILLFLAVAIGSAIPFVPTGEMVSGSSALAAHSRLDVFLIFLITWVASVLGDTVLLLEARMGSRRLRPWLERRKYADRVHEAEKKLHSNAFTAIVTGRLVPGGRAPVIIALGLGRFPLRRFLPADLVGCGLWALIYSTIGSIGGKIANHPLWGMVIAIAFAVCISLVVQQVIKFVQWRRKRRTGEQRQYRELDAPADLLDELSYVAAEKLINAEGDQPTPDQPTPDQPTPDQPRPAQRPEMRASRSPKQSQHHSSADSHHAG